MSLAGAERIAQCHYTPSRDTLRLQHQHPLRRVTQRDEQTIQAGIIQLSRLLCVTLYGIVGQLAHLAGRDVSGPEQPSAHTGHVNGNRHVV